jgi:hypothetical protein
VKALVTGNDPFQDFTPETEALIRRTAVFAALVDMARLEVEMLRAQQRVVEAIASPRLTASEREPSQRPSAQALAEYVEVGGAGAGAVVSGDDFSNWLSRYVTGAQEQAPSCVEDMVTQYMERGASPHIHFGSQRSTAIQCSPLTACGRAGLGGCGRTENNRSSRRRS